MSSDAEQSILDTFSVMNRYDERHADYDSSAVFEHPRRTLGNYWAKFHADRDCGARNVSYVEQYNWRTTAERHEYILYCWKCGHEVHEDEVLFIGVDWFSKHGCQIAGSMIDDLYIPPERVLELGPDPDRDELEAALEISRIENEAGPIVGIFSTDRFRECDDCGQLAGILFDDRCRMCYDGPWTDRLQKTVDAFENKVREQHNRSFVHRLPQKVDPLTPHGSVGEGTVLWRRRSDVPAPKAIVTERRFEDTYRDHDHREYLVRDLVSEGRHHYAEDDIAEWFWDTGLTEGYDDEDIDDLRQRFQERDTNA